MVLSVDVLAVLGGTEKVLCAPGPLIGVGPIMFLYLYIFAFSILLMCYNEVSEILELKKRLPDVVMTVVFPGM